jgi:hypothetical protein
LTLGGVAKKPKKPPLIGKIGYKPRSAVAAAAAYAAAISRHQAGVIMAEPTDMLAREIEDDLRRERLLQLWDKYGTYVLVAALAVVVGVGGYKFYENRKAEANAAASTRYIIGLRDFAMNKPGEAQKTLEDLAANAPKGYATLSRLRLAGYDQGAGNVAEATSAYEDIAKDRNIDPILADYAQLQIALLKLDTASFTELKNRLTPLASDKNPWRFSARELLGMAAYKSGSTAEARNYFQRVIGDRTAPPGVAERARTMLAIMAEAEQASAPAPATQKSEPSAKDDKAPAKGPGSKPK